MEHIKEVLFIYCSKCEYQDKEEDSDECAECLDHPGRYDSHKPINFKEKE